MLIGDVRPIALSPVIFEGVLLRFYYGTIFAKYRCDFWELIKESCISILDPLDFVERLTKKVIRTKRY